MWMTLLFPAACSANGCVSAASDAVAPLRKSLRERALPCLAMLHKAIPTVKSLSESTRAARLENNLCADNNEPLIRIPVQITEKRLRLIRPLGIVVTHIGGYRAI